MNVAIHSVERQINIGCALIDVTVPEIHIVACMFTRLLTGVSACAMHALLQATPSHCMPHPLIAGL